MTFRSKDAVLCGNLAVGIPKEEIPHGKSGYVRKLLGSNPDFGT